jgi:peptidyl-prolyl cis-trans isomerase C
MPRWIASPVMCLSCIAGLILATLTWTADAPRAEMLSTGVLSDQADEADHADPPPGDPLNPSSAPRVSPFAGIRPPSTDAATVVGPPADPVVANVDGHPIYLSQLGQAVQSLPENLRTMPFEAIYPLLLDRMIDHEALVLLARREKLDEDPKVVRQIDDATARVLEGALLARTVVPEVTEDAIKARYQRDFADQSAIEEVHARHILVGTETEAKWVIQELGKGADFVALAKRFSKDPDAARGGDVGFFRRNQVWPAFADLAFSLKPGEIGQTPVYNEFGWHVVQALERRTVPPPTFDQMHEAIRQQLLQEAVQRVVAQAREGLRVHKFNMTGAPSDNTTGSEELGAPVPNDPRPTRTSAQPAATAPAPAATPARATAAPQTPTPPPQKTGN